MRKIMNVVIIQTRVQIKVLLESNSSQPVKLHCSCLLSSLSLRLASVFCVHQVAGIALD